MSAFPGVGYLDFNSVLNDEERLARGTARQFVDEQRGDSGLRSFVSVQSGLVMYPIHAYGSPAQKNKWLLRLQRGKAIGCFGLTEPQFGSNPGEADARRAPRRPLHSKRRKNVDY